MAPRASKLTEALIRKRDDATVAWRFFRQWLKAPLTTAAVSPSSQELAAEMLRERRNRGTSQHRVKFVALGREPPADHPPRVLMVVVQGLTQRVDFWDGFGHHVCPQDVKILASQLNPMPPG